MVHYWSKGAVIIYVWATGETVTPTSVNRKRERICYGLYRGHTSSRAVTRWDYSFPWQASSGEKDWTGSWLVTTSALALDWRMETSGHPQQLMCDCQGGGANFECVQFSDLHCHSSTKNDRSLSLWSKSPFRMTPYNQLYRTTLDTERLVKKQLDFMTSQITFLDINPYW